MAAIALNGHRTVQSIKSGHVTYDIERYTVGTFNSRWEYDGSESTDALIKGNIQSSLTSICANGTPICVAGDSVDENWTASPPVPSNTSRTRYYNIRPGTSDSGRGYIAAGNNSNVYANGKLIAVQGSTVTTHLNTSTTIQEGNQSVHIGG
ncbi:hypothetical protein ABN764_02435 [Paenibacillaceae sp. P-4]|uniref:hypothetical protein n=1 Tax=Paenibacillaceae bacterium P-4 TaxID=3160969 RepID=UPI0032E84AAD